MTEKITLSIGDGARATFVLAAEADQQQGTVDLTDMIDILVRLGLRHPHKEPDDGVDFGTIELDGTITVQVGDRMFDDSEIAEALGAGFVHAIKQAIDQADQMAADRGSGA